MQYGVEQILTFKKSHRFHGLTQIFLMVCGLGLHGERWEIGDRLGVALEAASSGLQNIVPLLTLIDWLPKGIYQENKPYPFEEIEKIRHLLDEVGKDLSLSDNDSLKERLAGIVSVWQISDGSLIDIKDGRTNTIGKHYFNDVMNDILDDYYLMVPYLKIAKS